MNAAFRQRIDFEDIAFFLLILVNESRLRYLKIILDSLSDLPKNVQLHQIVCLIDLRLYGSVIFDAVM